MTWSRVPLQQIGRWYGGGTPSKGNAAFWQDGTIPWLSPKDMGPSTILSTQDHITPAAVNESAANPVPAGSVAVVVRSGILERTLPIGLVPFETTLNQDMKAVVPREGIDVRWVAWGLRAFERDLLGDTRKAGTTVASIEMPRFHSFHLPVPSLAEQRRIIEILEDHFSRVDAADSYLQRCLRRTARLLELVLRREFASLGGDRTNLAAVANWGSGGTPKAKTPKYYEGGHIPWVNSGDLRNAVLTSIPRSITEEGLAESSAKWVPPGAVLVAMYGATIGRTAITTFPVTTNQAVAFARPRDGVVSTEYLWWYLRSQAISLAAAGQGGAQPNISQTVLKSWPIDVPSPGRQKEVVDTCSAWEVIVKEASREVGVAQARSAALRCALLTAAFSGKLTERHTDQEVIEEMADA